MSTDLTFGRSPVDIEAALDEPSLYFHGISSHILSTMHNSCRVFTQRFFNNLRKLTVRLCCFMKLDQRMVLTALWCYMPVYYIRGLSVLKLNWWVLRTLNLLNTMFLILLIWHDKRLYSVTIDRCITYILLLQASKIPKTIKIRSKWNSVSFVMCCFVFG